MAAVSFISLAENCYDAISQVKQLPHPLISDLLIMSKLLMCTTGFEWYCSCSQKLFYYVLLLVVSDFWLAVS